MDEVDGMSGGDRGGVGAMNALIKKTKVSSTPFLFFFMFGIRKLISFSSSPIRFPSSSSATIRETPR